jgi:hypothetical protein
MCARDIGPHDANAAWPEISVIILCLNHDAFSQDAIAGISNQDCPRRQPIVMDGGSTAASVVLPNNFLETDYWQSMADIADRRRSHAWERTPCGSSGEQRAPSQWSE